MNKKVHRHDVKCLCTFLFSVINHHTPNRVLIEVLRYTTPSSGRVPLTFVKSYTVIGVTILCLIPCTFFIS